MDFMQSETRLNLARSFAGESQARTRYTLYASCARKQGYEWAARILEETATNETAHASAFLKMLKKLGGCADNIDFSAGYPYQIAETGDNLRFAAAGETHEHDDIYPGFAETARREGFDEAARLWQLIAKIEGHHADTFTRMEKILRGELTPERPLLWRCLKCGYTYEAIRPVENCPVCQHGSGWQERSLME